jgi:hypothetical protein
MKKSKPAKSKARKQAKHIRDLDREELEESSGGLAGTNLAGTNLGGSNLGGSNL